MNEIDKYGIEFSKLYNRFMRLEILIKDKAFNVITKTYKGKSYNVFFLFFKNLYSIKKYVKRTSKGSEVHVLRQIMDLPISDREKLKRLISELYLPELLRLVLNDKNFDTYELRKHFYFKIPQSTNYLWQKRRLLVAFRNAIAHYNFEQYIVNKKDYWDVLQLFENYLGHNIPGVEQLPYFGSKPNTRMILESIYKLRSDLFKGSKDHSYNKDRLLLELFDDIAIYNSYATEELPSPWTILRAMFKFKENHPDLFPKKIKKTVLENSQLGLFN